MVAETHTHALRTDRRDTTALGIAYMLGAASVFSVMVVLLRLATEAIHPFQAAFFRGLFGLAFMLPWLASTGWRGLATGQLRWHFARAASGLVAILGWFYAIAHLPMAEAVSLSFTTPLFVTIGAALLMGEVVRVRRWTATVIGFGGVLLILRPGVSEVSLASMVVLGSAAAGAVSALLIKRLSRTETPAAIVTYMAALMTPMAFLAALPVWITPSWGQLGLLVAVAACGTGGHVLFARAMRHAEASAIMPLDYLRLPFVALIGYVAFGELMDAFSWAGALVVIGAAIYIARRESIAARSTARPATIPVAATAHREKY